MLNSLLALDTEALIYARGLVGPQYAHIIQILGESIVVWGACVLLWIWFRGHFRHDTGYKYDALRIFFTIVLVFGIYAVINFLVPQWRPSPTDVVGGVKPLIPHPIDNSFPSGHALFAAALFVGIWNWYKRPSLLILTTIIGLATMIARVIGGVHYPGDIIGGIFFGGIGAILLTRVVKSLFFENHIYPSLVKIASWIKL